MSNYSNPKPFNKRSFSARNSKSNIDIQNSNSDIAESAKAYQRALLGFGILSSLSFLTLAGPDHALLPADAALKIPYLSVDVNVSSFLLFGPFILLSAWVYQELCRVRVTELDPTRQQLLFGVASDSLILKLITFLFSYLLLPCVLVDFFWVALPRPEAKSLFLQLGFGVLLVFGLFLNTLPKPTQLLQFSGAKFWSAWIIFCTLALSLSFWTELPKLVIDNFRSQRFINLTRAPFLAKDLSRIDLRGAKLNGANLSASNLTLADFSSAHMRQADLTNATAIGTNLAKADLTEAKLNGTWFQRTTFGNAIATASIQHAKFFKADLRNVTFMNALGCSSYFNEALLESIDFESADLGEANFDKASLSRINFANASLVDAIFSNATMFRTDFSGADVERTNFIDSVILDQPAFRDGYLAGAKFNRAVLRGADFSRVHFEPLGKNNKNVDGARLLKRRVNCDSGLIESPDLIVSQSDPVRFDGARMCNAIFSDSQMENVQFIGTVLKGSQFTNVGIHDARLTKADLGRARLTRVTFGLTSNIEGVIFDEAILTNVHFSTKSLKNVRFHGSTLVDTDFREVNSCAGVSFASADLSRILVSREMRQDFDPDTEFAPLYKCLREATSIKKIKVSKTFNKWLQNKDKKLASSTEIRRNENTATAERDSPNEGAFLAVPNETPKCNPEMGIVRDLIVQPKFSTPAESSTQQKGLPPFDRQRIIDN